jgi:hypothetical protein
VNADALTVALFDARAAERGALAELDHHKQLHGCVNAEALALADDFKLTLPGSNRIN